VVHQKVSQTKNKMDDYADQPEGVPGETGDPSPSAPSAPFPPEEEKKMTLAQFCEKHELFTETRQDLEQFKKDEVSVIFVIDDSSSMNTEDCIHVVEGKERCRTRWAEQGETVCESVSLALCLGCPSISIRFLNAPDEIKDVKSAEEVQRLFRQVAPKGLTPLNETLEKVYAGLPPHRNVLLLLSTDGRPSPSGPKMTEEQSIKRLKHLLGKQYRDTKYVGVQILACTQDKQTMKYLNKWDKQISHLDVTDDYDSERNQLEKLGKRMDRGTYVVKCFLGGWFRKWDKTDERRCLIL
jgi:hypothetical protein